MRPEEVATRLGLYKTMLADALKRPGLDKRAARDLDRAQRMADQAAEMSTTRYGRCMWYMGFIQGTMVAHGIVSAGDLLRINRKCDEDVGYRRKGPPEEVF